MQVIVILFEISVTLKFCAYNSWTSSHVRNWRNKKLHCCVESIFSTATIFLSFRHNPLFSLDHGWWLGDLDMAQFSQKLSKCVKLFASFLATKKSKLKFVYIMSVRGESYIYFPWNYKDRLTLFALLWCDLFYSFTWEWFQETI